MNRLDILTENASENVRRVQARDLAATVVQAIFRLVKQAGLHSADNQAVVRQVDDTVHIINDYCERTDQNVSILFAYGSIFVGGQLLKANRVVYEGAQELGEILRRFGFSELAIARGITKQDLFALVAALGEAQRSGRGQSLEKPTQKIRMRAVGESALRRGAVVDNLEEGQAIVRAYASAIVIMRRFFESLRRGRYELPQRVKRIAQSLVDLSAGDTPAFLGVTAVRNANYDEAGKAVNSAILAVSVARQITDDIVMMSRIAMSALLYDVARPRLTGVIGPNAPAIMPRLSEAQELEVPAASAVVLTALGRVNEPSVMRTVIAYEAHWAARKELGPHYGGLRIATMQARILATARRFNDLLTPAPGLEAASADDAITSLESEAADPTDINVVRLLIGALGIFPTGTLVQLGTAEVALVVQTPPHPAQYSLPRVRLVYDPQGNRYPPGHDMDLASLPPSDPRRAISRVVAAADDASRAEAHAARQASRVAHPTGEYTPISMQSAQSYQTAPSGQSQPSFQTAPSGQSQPSFQTAPSGQSHPSAQMQPRHTPTSGARSPAPPQAQPRNPTPAQQAQHFQPTPAPVSAALRTPPPGQMSAAPAGVMLSRTPTRTPEEEEYERKRNEYADQLQAYQEQLRAYEQQVRAYQALHPDYVAPALPGMPSPEQLDADADDDQATQAAVFGGNEEPQEVEGGATRALAWQEQAQMMAVMMRKADDAEASAPTRMNTPPPEVLRVQRAPTPPPQSSSAPRSRQPTPAPIASPSRATPPPVARQATPPPADPAPGLVAGLVPTAEGNLTKTPLVHLLVYMLDQQLTGTTVFRTADGATHFVFFDHGVASKVRTGTLAHTLDRVLLEMGVLDEGTLRDSLVEISKKKMLHGRYLVSKGLCDGNTIMKALRLQLVRKITHLFELAPQTEYAFYADENLLEDYGGPELTPGEPLSLIMTGVRLRGDDNLIDNTLSRLKNRKLALHIDSEVRRFEFRRDETQVVDFLRVKKSTVDEVLGAGVAQDRVVKLVLYALAITRHLDYGAAGKPPIGVSRERVKMSGVVEARPMPAPEPRVSTITSSAQEPEYEAMEAAGGAPPMPHVPPLVAEAPRAPAPPVQSFTPQPFAAPPQAPQFSAPPQAPQFAPQQPQAFAPQQPSFPPQQPSFPPQGYGAQPSFAPPGPPSMPPPPPAPPLNPYANAGFSMPPPASTRSGPPQPFGMSVAPQAFGSPAAQGTNPPPSQRGGSMSPPADDDLSPEHRFRKAEIETKASRIDTEDLFTMLGVSRTTSQGDIQTAYFKMAKMWHPDRVPQELSSLKGTVATIFARLNEAYALLNDPAKRADYVRELDASAGGAPMMDEEEQVQKIVDAAIEFQKAEVLLKRNDLVTAEAFAMRAAAADPTQGEYVAVLCWIKAMRRGDPPVVPDGKTSSFYDDILAQLDDIVRREPALERAVFYRGVLNKRTGRDDRALRDFRMVATLNPKNIDAMRELRIYQMRKERKAKEETGLLGKLFKK